MGAGRVGELVFLGQIDGHGRARALLERLAQALEQQGLRMESLLRLRVFAADLDAESDIEHALEQLLPRHRWPAVTLVEMPAGARCAGGMLSLDAVAARDPHIPRQAIYSPEPQPGEEPRGPAAVRYGPWVFVGAIAGESQRRHSLPRRIELESRSLFACLEGLLGTTGARLADIVKVGGWLTFPMSAYGPLGKVRGELLAQHDLLPASAAVQMGRLPGARGPLLAFEAVAFAPVGEVASRGGSDEHPPPGARQRMRARRASDPARPSSLAGYYATARRAGDYVFTCGEIPRSRASVREQASDVYEQLSSHLREHGASPSNTVQQTVFVRNREDIAALKATMRASCVSRAPTIFVPAADMGFRPDVDVEIELIAESPERGPGQGEST